MSEESATERLRFAWLVTAAFVLLTVPRLLLHELWRDEAWVWQVVTESRSVTGLFPALGRSGLGYLFPLLCFLARQVSTSLRAMQFLHLILAGAAAFAFVRYAPFGRRERALFVFGYFPFYEYAVISRNYVTGLLLVWLGCAAARSRRPALALGAVLGLLCQTTVYGYILALALAGGWLFDRWCRRHELTALPWAEAAGGSALALAGAAAGLVQLIPWRDRVLLALLIIHCGVGAYASWMDLRYPFSNGAATAELSRSEGLDRYPLFGHREPPAETVALYLGRPLYSPSRKIFVTPWEEIEAAGSRVGAIQGTEDYHLYWLRYSRLGSTAQAAGCADER